MNLFRYRRLALAVLVALITIVGLVTMHVVVGYFPWQSGSFPEDVSWKMVSAARMLGVLVPLLIMVQVSLVVRIPLCNALFGLPGLIRAHRILAGIIVVLALGHFLLILVSGTSPMNPISLADVPRIIGALAVILVVCGLGVAFFRESLGIAYHIWSRLHGPVMILATVLIYAHVFTVGYAFTSWSARLFMIVFMVATLGAILWGKLVRPFLIRKRTWTIRSVTQPHPDVVDLQIIPETSRPWSYHAGQFAFLTFLTPGLSREAHPFTIASAPSSMGCLRFLIKQCGDFTTRLSDLRPADRVLVDGPFGVFSLFFQSEKMFSRSLVFIAGGIGITPFLAMLEALSRAKHAPPILLVWSVQKKQDLFLSEQFAGFRQSIQEPEVHYFVTRDPSYQGATQRMNTRSLRPLLEEWTDSRVFVCGPPGMNKSVLRSLEELGFDSKQVITERFSL